MNCSTQYAPNYRSEIDGLRAFSVLSIILFHAFPDLLKGGFIGVDIFFVISGFLITRHIFEKLDKEKFSFIEFFGRRIKRIFPALIFVMAVSLLFGWFVLYAEEYSQLGKHIANAAAFILNFTLVNESGYFDNAAETKPLLHLWSLAVEEQFYIIWPFVLWASWRLGFNLLVITVIVATISFYLNLRLAATNPINNFFWPLGRFWELLSGSILAWLQLYKGSTLTSIKLWLDKYLIRIIHFKPRLMMTPSVYNTLSLCGFLILVYGVIRLNEGLGFPSTWGLIPILGTVLIISAGAKASLNRVLLMNPLCIWFGLISYPLYLWHWPILSFAKIVENEPLSYDIQIAIILLSVVLAWFTYRFIESPIRFGYVTKTKLTILSAALACIGLIGYQVYKNDGLPFRSVVVNNAFLLDLNWPYWIDQECADKYKMSPCQASSDAPNLMIIGDSHANHLYPGISRALGPNIGVYSAGTCTPAQGINVHVYKNPGHPCKDNAYLRNNFRILDQNPNIKTVVISSSWQPVLNAKTLTENDPDWTGLRIASTYPLEDNFSVEDLLYIGISRTVSELLSKQVDIVFVRDTPHLGVDIRDLCGNRFAQSKKIESCSLSRDKFNSDRSREDRLIAKLELEFPSLKVFDPFDYFCSLSDCHLIIDGHPLYRDDHHLSVFGSEYLGKAIVETKLINLMDK